MTEEKSGVKIVIDTESYKKERNANGQLTHHNGDIVASNLVHLKLDETYEVAAALLEVPEAELREKYAKLNLGQQRMNLGNRIRGAVSRLEKTGEGVGDANFLEACAAFDGAIRQREAEAAEAAKAKAAAKAEREEKAAAKKAAKGEAARAEAAKAAAEAEAEEA